jgi:hypothetical protein
MISAEIGMAQLAVLGGDFAISWFTLQDASKEFRKRPQRVELMTQGGKRPQGIVFSPRFRFGTHYESYSTFLEAHRPCA